MSGGRQRTLPQVWRAPEGRAERRDAAGDSDDELLLAAAAAADPGPPQGFSEAAGSIWIYPTNLPVRPYQERMAGAALLANTLVCLPTGLGKTFVAAVVMYNFYRWFPSGKVLFLAPTKPLVAQQMEACGRVMGIPCRDMAEMTGGTQALGRRELWSTKRVFFLTPQIMVNDLSRGTCPAVEIKCLVIDEAHKALGNHAYCQVVRELSKYTNQFRVLALSATPGSDTKAVQQVISNLLIAQIEVCAEDSPEIQPYSHERQVEKIVVPLGEELMEIQNTYIKVLEAFAGRLIRVGVLSRRDIPSLTKYQIILARDQYRKNPSAQHAGIHQGIIEGDFALCISLYHGYELLLQMGIRSLFIYLWGIMDGSKGLSRTKSELGRNEDFMELYQQLQAMFSDTAVTPESGSAGNSTTALEKKKEFVYSHPKLKKLEEIVIEHFRSWKQGGSDEDRSEGCPGDTRVMIFSSFRDSVQEIAEMLARLRPAVRAMTFVGHSSGKSTKGFTQKEQLEVVRRFREGGYNTLVSTCVGEEGLDIGEVDLIVCFDAQRSPVRLVQRMGRTGRRRHGRIVVILAQGREERTYNQSQCNKRSIHKAISGNKTLRFYQHSPRMVPEGINPRVHKMFITAEKQEQSTSRLLSTEGRRSSLQHKSALLACGTGQKQKNSHESWSLSPEEFEIWDRLYRIKESDGIKEPVLPRAQFETLEGLEETPKPEEGAAQELSLSEWSIWQNQPLPTSLVDHSDRCLLFIRAMEMMELMRLQQGDCSYEQELQPHLRMEDVNIPGNRRNPSVANPPWDQRGRCSRKDLAKSKPKPFPPDAADDGSEFFTTFKTTRAKAPRRAPGLREEVPVVPQDPPGPPSGTRLAVPGHSHPGSDKDEGLEVTFELNAFIDLCDNSDSSETPASPAAEENSPAGEACGALGRIHRDSGYETSPVASELFYLPESCRDSFTLLGPPQQPPGLEQTFSQVQRLLSQSPPSGDELQGLESLLREEGTKSPSPKVLPDGRSEALQDSVSPVSPKADPSLLLLENPKVAVPRELCASRSPHLSKTVSSAKAAAAEEEQLWNDSFDGLFDSEEFPEIPNNAPSRDHPLTNGPSKEPFLPKDTAEAALGVPGEEQSLHLFEDEAGEDMGEGSPKSTEPPARAGPAGTIPGAEGEPSRELPCVSPTQPCRGSMGTSAVALQKDDPYDCSQDLFSVTFDLGFSIEDSGDESPGESRNAGDPTLDRALGSARTALSDGSRLDTSPGWDCRRLERRDMSTPLSQQGRDRNGRGGTEGAPAAGPVLKSGGSRRGREPPEPLPSAPLTPTSRKGVNIKAVKRISMKVFSNAREQIPEVPPVDEVKESPWRQNCGRSALDSPSGRTESLENTKLPGSHAAGPSSDSEEEIVFQRKNRIKKNVLMSPDGMDQSDLESPARLPRKRRRPPNLSDTSSEDSGDFQRDRSSSRARPGGAKRARSCVTAEDAGRQFLEEEAEVSLLEAEGISSDESDGTGQELSQSLVQFLDDEGEPTQALSDSEMRAVYLSSVRSPALGSRYKMVHKDFNPSAIFSQIPEQDVTYAEDSFCVGDEEEEAPSGCSEEEECVDFELLTREGSRQQYLTRRRRRLSLARRAGNAPAPVQKKKPSRIIVLSDSSEDEMGASRERPLEAGQGRGQLPKALPSAPSAQPRSGAGEARAPQAGGQDTERLLGLEASMSGMLDPPPQQPGRRTSIPPAGSGCRNTDLQAGAEVFGSWKKTRGSSSGSACPAVPNPSSATARISSVPSEHSPSPAGISRVPSEHSPSPAGISRVPSEHSPSPAGISRVPSEHSPSPAGIPRVPSEHSPSPAGISRVPSEHSPSPAGIPRVPGEHSPSPAGIPRVPGKHSPSPAGISRVPSEHSPSPAGISRVPSEHSPSPAGISRVPGEHSPSPAGISRVPSDHSPSAAGISRVPSEHSPSLCILADSRETCSGPEVLSCLRAGHGLRVQVCSLGSSDYIVSNRLAVDRVLQSELQSPGNRNKLSQRLQRLQGIFERICVIVETDRVRPGETSRCFQRTQHYDGVLSALVQAGIRILFSSCQEETAALLKELALLEHRKDAAIQVPTEPEGHRRDILNFYLSIPNLSYGAALNLCHSFGSITAVANSSVPALAAGARLSRPQAEELHRFLRHDFDLQLLPQPLPAKGKG
ncbi:Fanconi anemia group M protein isoform X2 [Serinus canaria]|uniref:Fanconi anemia group M protein isoform X2 n=1 Tax=Serinus canaria TaxID=9135 RepID=UPI0021CC7B53|nr:Fanconi anemia group M protein isoform X2 [Serinus canaria]